MVVLIVSLLMMYTMSAYVTWDLTAISRIPELTSIQRTYLLFLEVILYATIYAHTE